LANRFAGALTGLRMTVTLDERDRTKNIAKIGRMQRNIPRYANRTGRIIAERGRDVARKIIVEKESKFEWNQKGQLRRTMVVRNVENSPERNVFELAATASYAWQVENGLIPRSNVPIGETSKLLSWARAAAEARGSFMEEAFPKGTMNIAGRYSAPWVKTGMKFMEAAGNSMIQELRNEIPRLGIDIINS